MDRSAKVNVKGGMLHPGLMKKVHFVLQENGSQSMIEIHREVVKMGTSVIYDTMARYIKKEVDQGLILMDATASFTQYSLPESSKGKPKIKAAIPFNDLLKLI